MITDIQQLINACEQELHDREYHAHHADFITNEWKGISQWCQKMQIVGLNGHLCHIRRTV